MNTNMGLIIAFVWMTLLCYVAEKQQKHKEEHLTGLIRGTLQVLKDLVQAGVQVLHPVVDMVLVLLNGI